MKTVNFGCAKLFITQKDGNSFAAHTRKVLPCSVIRVLSKTNLALKVTSRIRVSNLMKIGEKLSPLALTKDKISLLFNNSVKFHSDPV